MKSSLRSGKFKLRPMLVGVVGAGRHVVQPWQNIEWHAKDCNVKISLEKCGVRKEVVHLTRVHFQALSLSLS